MPSASLAILSDLVAFDTTSHKSNLPLIEYVEAYLADHGIASERVPDETGQKANLWATIGPPDMPGIVLSGHTDVVPAAAQNWRSDPFRAEERDGRLYGRGTADMKGFIAVCLALVPEMQGRRLAKPLHLALSYDEEVGCIGVRGLIRRFGETMVRPEACIVGEPTGMQVVIGHKGKRNLQAQITGRPMHSANAPQGVNAIDYAARLVLKIREIADRLGQTGARDPLFNVPYTTAQTGTIQGGSALNIVPEKCELAFEFRMLAREDLDALQSEVVDYARTVLEPEMKRIAPEAGIAFAVTSDTPGLDQDPEAPIVTLAKSLAERNDHAKVDYGTEAGLFDRAGVPTVICGPGSIAQAHKADEFIALSEIARCETFLGRLIDRCTA